MVLLPFFDPVPMVLWQLCADFPAANSTISGKHVECFIFGSDREGNSAVSNGSHVIVSEIVVSERSRNTLWPCF